MRQDFLRTKTSKGTLAILFEQNLFRLHFVNKSLSERWICTKFKCYCTILLENDKIISINGKHNHRRERRCGTTDSIPCNDASDDIEQLKSQLKQMEIRCQLYEKQLDDNQNNIELLLDEINLLKDNVVEVNPNNMHHDNEGGNYQHQDDKDENNEQVEIEIEIPPMESELGLEQQDKVIANNEQIVPKSINAEEPGKTILNFLNDDNKKDADNKAQNNDKPSKPQYEAVLREEDNKEYDGPSIDDIIIQLPARPISPQSSSEDDVE